MMFPFSHPDTGNDSSLAAHVDTITSMNDEATYICDTCGEEIVVPIDPSAGSHQKYVEDCPVCCTPHVIHVEIDEDADIQVWGEAE